MMMRYDILDEMIKRDTIKQYPAQDVLPGFLGTFNPDDYDFRFDFYLAPRNVPENEYYAKGMPESLIDAVAERISYLFSERRIIAKTSPVHIYTNHLDYKSRGYDTECVRGIEPDLIYNSINAEIGVTLETCPSGHIIKLLEDVEFAVRLYAEREILCRVDWCIYKRDDFFLTGFPRSQTFYDLLLSASEAQHHILHYRKTLPKLNESLDRMTRLVSGLMGSGFEEEEYRRTLLDVYRKLFIDEPDDDY